ncbi:MAG: DNRLRE domain-containing protein, partial [Chloroflexota bacterium]
MPDGTFTAEFSMGRINYLDEAGEWQPIDLTLVEDPTSPYGLRTRANSFDLRISPDGASDSLAELSLNGHVIRLRQISQTLGAGTTTDDRITYQPAPGRGAVSLVPTPEGLEFNVRIDDASQAGTYQFVLDTGGLAAEPGPDGRGVLLRDTTGAVVASLSPPNILDANEQSAPQGVINVSLDGAISEVPAPSESPVVSSTPDAPTPEPPTPPASPSDEPLPSPTPSVPGTSVPQLTPASDPQSSPGITPEPVLSPTPEGSVTPSVPIETPIASPTAEPTALPSPTAPAPLGANEVLLSYTIDPAWLAEPSRAYPIVLDPTICLQKGQTVEPTGCDDLGDATGYLDHFLTSGNPYGYPYGWNEVRVGTDVQADGFAFGKMRALFYWPSVTLQDGAQLKSATVRLRQVANFGSSQQMHFELITKGWHAQTTWNGQPTYSDVSAYEPVLTAAQVPAEVEWDVTSLARRWYTRNTNDWKANLGLMARLETETQSEVNFRNKAATEPIKRPLLILNYVIPKVSVAFDTTALGADFVPSTMPAGTTVGLPIKITNDASGFTFNNTGTDYYKVGYRWFDAVGKPVVQSGFTNWGTAALPTSVANNTTSGVITLPVAAPPQVGQYSLRLDLVHVIGSDNVWGSDWAKPSLYFSGAKASTDTSNTRVVGSSVVERAEFSVAVVSGGGTAFGETKTVGLADGSSLGVNLWSRNVRFDGVGGAGFEDLGGQFGVGYFYDSANRADCSGVLKACGWGTNFDEGFRPAAPGTDYVYVDAAGNRYLVGTTGSGQLVSSAGVRLERIRHTILDENWLTGVAWSSGWSGTVPTISTAQSYSSSGHSYSIPATVTGGTGTSSITQVDLDHFPLVSFAVKGVTATKGAIGFEISNETLGTTGWLAYTIGPDFTVAGVSKIALGGSISSWNETVRRDLRADAVTKALGLATHTFSVKSVKFWGPGGSGTLYYDAIRFQGREAILFEDAEPVWSANGTQADLYGADKNSGASSIKVLPVTEASSPNCAACVTHSLTTNPFVTWDWKKVGGNHIAMAFHVKDLRTNATGTITYYAGPVVATQYWVRIAETAPSAWTNITRNLLDDARQLFGFFDDGAATADSEDESQVGPRPDAVDLTGFRLIALDGNYGLFDIAEIHSLTNLGDDYASIRGDDFVVTLPGREGHYFNRDGLLLRTVDAAGNEVVLDWTYNFGTYAFSLTSVHAPSDGLALSSGTATRRLDLSTTSSTVRFTEVLNGVTGRYTDFARDGSNNLTTVIPARRSAACAGSGPTGCHKFEYVTGLLTKVKDPRDTGSSLLYATVTYSGTSPTRITSAATSTDLLRIHSWGSPTAAQWRPVCQDANGIAGVGSTEYARQVDMTPNGSLLIEYRPLPCVTNPGCTNGTTNPSTPTDKLVQYTTDGIDNYQKQTHYRLTGNQGAVVTRTGSYAAAQVDNLVDPLTARLTPWTQSASQYAASDAGGNQDLYRTIYTYNADGMPTLTSTPFANPAGSVVNQGLTSRYDANSNLLETSDATFLTNPGFESGLGGTWSFAGSTTAWEQGAGNVNSGFGSLKVTNSGTATQTAQLLPGQTLRFQVALRVTAGAGATFQVDYERASDSTFQTLLAPTTDPSSSWKTLAYDLSIPTTGSGKIKVILKIGSGSGTVYFDDAVVLTTFAAASYFSEGRVDMKTDALNRKTKYTYVATTAHPEIFVTSVTANFVSGQPSTA